LAWARDSAATRKNRLKTIGVDLDIVWGGRSSEQAGGYAAGRPVRLSIQDAYVIKSEAYLIKTVSPELRRSVAEVSRYNADGTGRGPALRVGIGKASEDLDSRLSELLDS
jgi:hypothetical protein